MSLLLPLLFACTPPTAPTWPAGAALVAVVPSETEADGRFWIELTAPNALGARHRDFDVYELGYNGKISTTTELQESDRRPPTRSSRLRLEGSQTLTYRAGDYAMTRTTPTLTLRIEAPPAPEAPPQAP